MKHLKPLALTLLILFLLLAIVPFLVPVPPLQGTVPAVQLAEADSLFVPVNGLQVHYKQSGSGEPTFLLLHGFGASLFTWREVMDDFASLGRVIAYDRPAFGLTSRPLQWEGENPYTAEAQAALTIGLMDALGVQKAWLVGNSAGGTVALYTALLYPERISGLILVDAAIYAGGGSPAWARPLLNTPQMNHLGPLIARQISSGDDEFLRTAYHNPSLVTPAMLEGYRKPLRVQDWDKALWLLTAASRPLNLASRLTELNLPVLVITGDDDRLVPTADSLRLAEEIPNAALAVIPQAGHLPHEEKPTEFMQSVKEFLPKP